MEWNKDMDAAPFDQLVLVTDGTITAPGVKGSDSRWYFWEGLTRVDDYCDCIGDLNYWVGNYGPTHWTHMPEPPNDI